MKRYLFHYILHPDEETTFEQLVDRYALKEAEAEGRVKEFGPGCIHERSSLHLWPIAYGSYLQERFKKEKEMGKGRVMKRLLRAGKAHYIDIPETPGLIPIVKSTRLPPGDVNPGPYIVIAGEDCSSTKPIFIETSGDDTFQHAKKGDSLAIDYPNASIELYFDSSLKTWILLYKQIPKGMPLFGKRMFY